MSEESKREAEGAAERPGNDDGFAPSPRHAVTRPLSNLLAAVGRYALSILLSGPVLGLVTVLATFIVLIGLKGEAGALRNFLGWSNLQDLIYLNTPKAVLVLGMLLIIISGGIDLSVGSVVALVTVTTMVVFNAGSHAGYSSGMASGVAVITGLLVGGACGLGNGLIVTQMRVAPFVATLGMMSIARGLAYWLAEGHAVSFPEDVATPKWVHAFANAHPKVGLFNLGFWSAAALAAATAMLLLITILGRHAYAIGSNEPTARLCGVSINRVKIVLYTLAGLLTGWGGILMFTQLGSGEPTTAVGLELEVIAAVVIGGASLSGGLGNVGGALLGVLILGILQNGVSKFHVPVEIQYILIGAIIIVNTALSRWRQRG
jgi:ribose transport system permease protein